MLLFSVSHLIFICWASFDNAIRNSVLELILVFKKQHKTLHQKACVWGGINGRCRLLDGMTKDRISRTNNFEIILNFFCVN